WFWDFDNDGWEDLFVLSYDNRVPLHAAVAREYLGLPAEAPAGAATLPSGGALPAVEHAHLYRNKGDGTFEDVTESAGLADKAIYAMGSNFGDIDNDGWLDFYLGTGNPDLRSIIPNRMFRGVEGRRFEEVTLEGGFGHLQKGHGTAFADLDRDGDEDVYMVVGGAYAGDVFTSVLFENPGWPHRNWITLELEGRTANRSAIGARVEIVAADKSGKMRTVRRTIGTGGSFGSGTLQLHVGLGSAVHVPLVRVTWPDSARSTSSYPDLDVRKTYLLVQGQNAQMLDRPPVPFAHATVATDGHLHKPDK
ncbi:MAG TPA: FG-GAP-like repeat-containing protein, partial [Gemmatimonadaceae bacterium]